MGDRSGRITSRNRCYSSFVVTLSGSSFLQNSLRGIGLIFSLSSVNRFSLPIFYLFIFFVLSSVYISICLGISCDFLRLASSNFNAVSSE